MVKQRIRVMPNIPGLVKVTEASELLNLAYSALYRQIRLGLIPVVRVNGHPYIAQAVIDDRLEAKAVLEHLKQVQQYVDRVSTVPKRGPKKGAPDRAFSLPEAASFGSEPVDAQADATSNLGAPLTTDVPTAQADCERDSQVASSTLQDGG